MKSFDSTRRLIDFATSGENFSGSAMGPFSAEVHGRIMVTYKDFWGVWHTKNTSEFNPTIDGAPFKYARAEAVAA